MKRKINPILAAIAISVTVVTGLYYLNRDEDVTYMQGTVVELGQCVRRDGCALVVQGADGMHYHLSGRSPSTVGRPVTLKFFTFRGKRRMKVDYE